MWLAPKVENPRLDPCPARFEVRAQFRGFRCFQHFSLFELSVLVGPSPIFLCVCVFLFMLEESEQRVELRSRDRSELVLCSVCARAL